LSALTKVFIVLHVVLTMLLTAGLIVFVNRTENWKQASAGLESRLVTAKNEKEELNDQLLVTRSNYDHKLTALNGDLLNARNDLSTRRRPSRARTSRLPI